MFLIISNLVLLGGFFMTGTSGYLYKKITQRQEKKYNIFQVSGGLC